MILIEKTDTVVIDWNALPPNCTLEPLELLKAIQNGEAEKHGIKYKIVKKPL